MKISIYQKGVGLTEVLISMLILSIGVMGFVALQARATAATTEALKRSEALMVLQGLAEKIRVNPDGDYLVSAESKNCATKTCNADDQAKDDLYFFNNQYTLRNMKIATLECAGTSTEQKRVCLVAAWDNTDPTSGTISPTSTQIPCLTNDRARYQDGATCLLMEAYNAQQD